MNTFEIDQEKMKTLKEVADANVKLSEMKADMANLESEKENFFKLREDELIGKLKKTLDESQDFVNQTLSNYKQVKEFNDELVSFSNFIKESQSQLKEFVDSFQNEAKEIVRQLEEQDNRLEQQKRQIESDNFFIAHVS